jgi:glycine reductase
MENGMRLELGTFPVTELSFGAATRLDGERLTVDREAVRRLVADDPTFRAVDVEIVRPGEAVRVVHLADTVEPRVKVGGPGAIFPGTLGPLENVGEGRTHRLRGVAVMSSVEFPWRRAGGVILPTEAIVDMSGPMAAYCPFSETLNLVLVLDLVPDLTDDEYERAVRLAGLRVAAYLAECTRELTPPRIDVLDLTVTNPALPRVVYVWQVYSLETYGGQYWYGLRLDNLFPTLIHPNEVVDGALVSGQHTAPNVKHCTWLNQNNAIIQELYAAHGREYNFAGVILVRGRYTTVEEKQRVAHQSAKLARLLEADGAVVTWESSGNAQMDAILIVQACERAGIKTVFVTTEYGGHDGTDVPLIYHVPELDAIVSTGSVDQRVAFPPMPRAVGGDTIRLKPELGGVRQSATAAILPERRTELYCSGHQLGTGRITCTEF